MKLPTKKNKNNIKENKREEHTTAKIGKFSK